MRLRLPHPDEGPGTTDPGDSTGRSGTGMSELERLFHLFVSLQILFGSRRGGWGVPLLLLALFVGGWLAYLYWFSADPALGRADRKWESGESTQRIDAIKDYKDLLRKRDPLEPTYFWLKDRRVRTRLYRRIIEYHVAYDIDRSAAHDWINEAWGENIRDISFEVSEVNDFYRKVTEEIKAKQKSMGPLGGVLGK